jgi:hypothetical protein
MILQTLFIHLMLCDLSVMSYNGTARIFTFSLIIEGTTEKVTQFIMPPKSIFNRNFGFIEQKKVFLRTTESFKQEKHY